MTEQPSATLKMHLDADSGFESESEHRITLEQWEKINRILNGTERLGCSEPKATERRP